MIPRNLSGGRGITSLVRYLTHDAPTKQNRSPKTSERVAWVATTGASPTDDVDLTVRIMQGVTADAKIRKQQSGATGGGRKLRKPYQHLCFSFEPGYRPTQAEALELTEKMLDAIGCGDRLSISTAHQERDHFHVHTAVARVHPQTGIAAPLHNAGYAMAKVAEQWEQEHGIVVHSRKPRREAREAVAAEVRAEMAGFVPTAGTTKRQQQRELCDARKAARGRARERHPGPPWKKRYQRPGRPTGTPKQRADWARMYQNHQDKGTPDYVRRAERKELSKLHAIEHRIDGRRRVVLDRAPVVDEPKPERRPAPAAPPRVGLDPTPRVAEPRLERRPVPAPPPPIELDLTPRVAEPRLPAAEPMPRAVPAAVAVVTEPELALGEPLPAPSISPAPTAVVTEPELARYEPPAPNVVPAAVVTEPELALGEPLPAPSISPAPTAVVTEPELARYEPPAPNVAPAAVVAEPELALGEPLPAPGVAPAPTAVVTEPKLAVGEPLPAPDVALAAVAVVAEPELAVGEPLPVPGVAPAAVAVVAEPELALGEPLPVPGVAPAAVAVVAEPELALGEPLPAPGVAPAPTAVVMEPAELERPAPPAPHVAPAPAAVVTEPEILPARVMEPFPRAVPTPTVAVRVQPPPPVKPPTATEIVEGMFEQGDLPRDVALEQRWRRRGPVTLGDDAVVLLLAPAVTEEAQDKPRAVGELADGVVNNLRATNTENAFHRQEAERRLNGNHYQEEYKRLLKTWNANRRVDERPTRVHARASFLQRAVTGPLARKIVTICEMAISMARRPWRGHGDDDPGDPGGGGPGGGGLPPGPGADALLLPEEHLRRGNRAPARPEPPPVAGTLPAHKRGQDRSGR